MNASGGNPLDKTNPPILHKGKAHAKQISKLKKVKFLYVNFRIICLPFRK